MAKSWLIQKFTLRRLLCVPVLLGMLYTALDKMYLSDVLQRELHSPNRKFTCELWVRSYSLARSSFESEVRLVIRRVASASQATTIGTWDRVQFIKPELIWTTDSRFLLLTVADVVGREGSTAGRTSEKPKCRLYDGSRLLVLFDSTTGSTKINEPVRQVAQFTTDDLSVLRFFDPEPPPKSQQPGGYRGYEF